MFVVQAGAYPCEAPDEHSSFSNVRKYYDIGPSGMLF